MHQTKEKIATVRVTAPSRLHFGVFSLPPGGEGPAIERYFGGVGLMVEKPGVVVTATPAAQWSATGPSSARALAFARRLSGTPALAITVEQCAPEHVGLGTGTQLGLATARAAALATGRDLGAVELARRIGRGRRSALGLYGFAHGGLLVEGGKRTADAISPLIVRADFPEEWAVLLIVPRDRVGLAGQREQEAFARLAELKPDASGPDRLCRLVLLGLLPALAERDLVAFGESLFEFNRRVGEMFAPWQGGVYANPGTAKLIEALRRHGVRGVGQSSWGPGVFAIVPTGEGPALADWLIRRQPMNANEVIVTRGMNQGAQLQIT